MEHEEYYVALPMFTYYVYCCRHWPVSRLFPVGRCSICGEKPKEDNVNPDCECETCERVMDEIGGEG